MHQNNAFMIITHSNHYFHKILQCATSFFGRSDSVCRHSFDCHLSSGLQYPCFIDCDNAKKRDFTFTSILLQVQPCCLFAATFQFQLDSAAPRGAQTFRIFSFFTRLFCTDDAAIASSMVNFTHVQRQFFPIKPTWKSFVATGLPAAGLCSQFSLP